MIGSCSPTQLHRLLTNRRFFSLTVQKRRRRLGDTMAYAETVYKNKISEERIKARLSAESDAVVILTSPPKCPNYILQLEEASLLFMVICLTTRRGR